MKKSIVNASLYFIPITSLALAANLTVASASESCVETARKQIRKKNERINDLWDSYHTASSQLRVLKPKIHESSEVVAEVGTGLSVLIATALAPFSGGASLAVLAAGTAGSVALNEVRNTKTAHPTSTQFAPELNKAGEVALRALYNRYDSTIQSTIPVCAFLGLTAKSDHASPNEAGNGCIFYHFIDGWNFHLAENNNHYSYGQLTQIRTLGVNPAEMFRGTLLAQLKASPSMDEIRFNSGDLSEALDAYGALQRHHSCHEAGVVPELGDAVRFTVAYLQSKFGVGMPKFSENLPANQMSPLKIAEYVMATYNAKLQAARAH